VRERNRSGKKNVKTVKRGTPHTSAHAPIRVSDGSYIIVTYPGKRQIQNITVCSTNDFFVQNPSRERKLQQRRASYMLYNEVGPTRFSSLVSYRPQSEKIVVLRRWGWARLAGQSSSSLHSWRLCGSLGPLQWKRSGGARSFDIISRCSEQRPACAQDRRRRVGR